MSSASIIQVAKDIAKEILAGSVSPYDGGYRIWKECQLALFPGDHRLDPFVYWSSEYQQRVDPKPPDAAVRFEGTNCELVATHYVALSQRLHACRSDQSIALLRPIAGCF
jgi:hypothetical protein